VSSPFCRRSHTLKTALGVGVTRHVRGRASAEIGVDGDPEKLLIQLEQRMKDWVPALPQRIRRRDVDRRNARGRFESRGAAGPTYSRAAAILCSCLRRAVIRVYPCYPWLSFSASFAISA